MKQTIECTYHDQFDSDEKLHVIRSKIDQLIELFGESALFIPGNCCSLDFFIQYEREETDEEYAERLKAEEAKKNKSLASKKRQLEKLKKEIEDMECE